MKDKNSTIYDLSVIIQSGTFTTAAQGVSSLFF